MSPFNIGDELVELRSRTSRGPGRPGRRRLWLLALAAACVVGLGIVTFWLWGLRAPQGPALSTKALVRTATAAPLRWAELRTALPTASRTRHEAPIAFLPKKGSDPFARELPPVSAGARQEAGGAALEDVVAWQGDLEWRDLGEEIDGTEPSAMWVGPSADQVDRVEEAAVGVSGSAAGPVGAAGEARAADSAGSGDEARGLHLQGAPAGTSPVGSPPTQEGLAQEHLGSLVSEEDAAGKVRGVAAGTGADAGAQPREAPATGGAVPSTPSTPPTRSTMPSSSPAPPTAAPAPASAAGSGAAPAGAGGAIVAAPSEGALAPAAGPAATGGGKAVPAAQQAVPGAPAGSGESSGSPPGKAAGTGAKAADAGPKAADAGMKAVDTGAKAAETGTKAAETGTKAAETGAKGAPVAGTTQAVRTISAPLVKLTGVISVDGRAYAIVRTPLGSWIVRPGDVLEGMAVRSIEQKRIVVDWQGQEFSVELGGGVER